MIARLSLLGAGTGAGLAERQQCAARSAAPQRPCHPALRSGAPPSGASARCSTRQPGRRGPPPASAASGGSAAQLLQAAQTAPDEVPWLQGTVVENRWGGAPGLVPAGPSLAGNEPRGDGRRGAARPSRAKHLPLSQGGLG